MQTTFTLLKSIVAHISLNFSQSRNTVHGFVQADAGQASLPPHRRAPSARQTLVPSSRSPRLCANSAEASEPWAGQMERLLQQSSITAECAGAEQGPQAAGGTPEGFRPLNPNTQSGTMGHGHWHGGAGPRAWLQGYFFSQSISGTCRRRWEKTRLCLPLPPSTLWPGELERRHSGNACISLITQTKNSTWP